MPAFDHDEDRVSKAKDREGWDVDRHFYALDEDATRLEHGIEQLMQSTRRLTQAAVGVLISLATTSLLIWFRVFPGPK